MKFENYLIEKYQTLTDYDEDEMMVEVLKRDCAPYLNLLRKWSIPRPFLRAFRDEMYIPPLHIAKKAVRQDRQPLGMSSIVFKEFNKWLKKNGHVERDKSISTTSQPSIRFGTAYFVFPIGKFDYSFIEHAKDVNLTNKVYGTYSNFMIGIALGKPDERTDHLYKSDYDKEVIQWDKDRAMKELKGLINTNNKLKLAYDKGYEVWMNPKSYYLVNVDNPLIGLL